MQHIRFRMGQNRFDDQENYPDGFVESGLFTDAEEELLVYWGETMYALESGNLLPVNQEEEHFIRVLDKPEQANTALERVWLKYRQHKHSLMN